MELDDTVGVVAVDRFENVDDAISSQMCGIALYSNKDNSMRLFSSQISLSYGIHLDVKQTADDKRKPSWEVFQKNH